MNAIVWTDGRPHLTEWPSHDIDLYTFYLSFAGDCTLNLSNREMR